MSVCARVLAAALMSGAIAGALSFPAFVSQGREPQRALTAPASEHQRTLRLPALAAPAHHTIAVRKRVARTVKPVLIDVRIAPRGHVSTVVKHVATAEGGTTVASSPPASTPTPAPTAPAPEAPAAPAPAPAAAPVAAAAPTRQLAAEPQPAPPGITPATPPTPSADQGDDQGNGHCKGQDKQGGDGSGNGNGRGNGQGNGHDKEDAVRG